MARFCTQCGRELQEGEVCSCRTQSVPQTQQAAQTQEVPSHVEGTQTAPQQPNQAPYYPPQPAAPSPFATAMKQLGQTALQFFKKPVSTIDTVVGKNDYTSGLCFYVVQALLLTIFAAIVFNVLGSSVTRGIMGGLGSMGRMNRFMFNVGFGTLVRTFFFLLLNNAVMLVAAFASAKLLKSKTKFSQFIASMGYAAWPVTLAVVAAVILCALSAKLFGLIAVLGVFVACCGFPTLAIIKTASIGQDKGFWAAVLSYVMYALIITLIILVITL